MSKIVYHDGDEGVSLTVKTKRKKDGRAEKGDSRTPVHVVYGGADRFSADTARKLGDIALRTIEEYAPNFVAFANAMRLPRTEGLPHYPEAVQRLEEQIIRDPARASDEMPDTWFAYQVYRKTIEKLTAEPVEDFRIDFEDGYGIRSDEAEDEDAIRAGRELAMASVAGTAPSACGIRIKGFAPETEARAAATLDRFMEALLTGTNSRLPSGFVVTLPKVRSTKEIRSLCRHLKKCEGKWGLPKGAIDIEIMVETPDAIIDRRGRVPLIRLVEAGKGRITSAHFGAFDYTSGLGISGEHQDLRHPACDFARHIMLTALAPLGIRLSDSVTTEMPVPVHKGGELSEGQLNENRRAVHRGWRTHYQNVSRSMADGFYLSWDLHPNQLVARYAAVYVFFLSSMDSQARRLRRFVDQASKATLTGSTFDDAASARGIMNFFVRGLDCRAFSEDEVKALTGLNAEEIRAGRFPEIISA